MKIFIVANWKMNPQSFSEAGELLGAYLEQIPDVKGAQIVVCPPFIYLRGLTDSFFSRSGKKPVNKIELGSQNVFWEKSGAFTGEISPSMLRDSGCRYAIVGHSERRKHFGETDEMINKKIKALLEAKLTPIFCIGETEAERKAGKTFDVLRDQLAAGLRGIDASLLSSIIIAYEPVWAIGTSSPCSVEEARRAGQFIREHFGNKISILYGGSVNSQNAADYIKGARMDGLLVGGASLRAEEFTRIVLNCVDAYSAG